MSRSFFSKEEHKKGDKGATPERSKTHAAEKGARWHRLPHRCSHRQRAPAVEPACGTGPVDDVGVEVLDKVALRQIGEVRDAIRRRR